jgi:hypoxanthine phosphoribosyltransferase
MKKEFLPYDTVRNNTLKLAHRIYQEGFTPDVIYVSLRGGAYLGNVISEYFKIIRRGSRPVYYAAVVARSYTDVLKQDKVTAVVARSCTDVLKQDKVTVEGWTYDPAHLRTGDRVLLVDDIFDSGRTVNHLAGIILEKGIPRQDLKVAVHDYKYFYDREEQLPIQPDYWCRRHDLSVKDEELWIHYMSHELVGLSGDELEQYYYTQDSLLREALKVIA